MYKTKFPEDFNSTFHDEAAHKRNRRKTARFDFDELDNEEQRLVQQAIRNSQREIRRESYHIPYAPIYHPTAEEFQDPVAYINKIRPEAMQSGMCKIIPPAEWKPTCQITMSHPKTFPTRLQVIHKLQEGLGFEDGKRYTIQQYKDMSDQFALDWARKYFQKDSMSAEEIAQEYWDIVETATREVTVEYGNDLDTMSFGSGFPVANMPKIESSVTDAKSLGDSSPVPIKCEVASQAIVNDDVAPASLLTSVDSATPSPASPSSSSSRSNAGFSAEFYSQTPWNLTKLPSCEDSILKFIIEPITGVNVPWLYIGMLFSSFCWHTEDNYLYSINYSHFGSVKHWYGVPSTDAKLFEKISKDFLFESFRDSPDLLHYMTTQISPNRLIAGGVRVCQTLHEPGTFVITFPQAYHGGFSHGFNCGEAVNFALPDWLPYGGEAIEKYRLLARPTVFSHERLLFTMFHNLGKAKLDSNAMQCLARTVLKSMEEELALRPLVLASGIRDISGRVNMPANNFTVLDKQSLEYDDLRTCCICKHICLFSAVACECDRARVCCLRHSEVLCKCPQQKRFFLSWAPTSSLVDVQQKMKTFLHGKPKLQSTPVVTTAIST